MINLAKNHPKLSGEVVSFFCEKRWIEELQENAQNIPKLQWIVKNSIEVEHTRIKQRINSLPENDRKQKALYLLTNWKSIAEYEAAILVLIDIGNEVIPDLIKLLEINIPATSPPPFKKIHTNFSAILTTLKSIPDVNIDKLEKLSKSKNEYIAKEASNVLKWVKSEVPYPFKYERILFSSHDEGY